VPLLKQQTVCADRMLAPENESRKAVRTGNPGFLSVLEVVLTVIFKKWGAICVFFLLGLLDARAPFGDRN